MVSTAAEKLAKEPIDRLLGRLTPDQRQVLAYAWASHAVTQLLPPHLEGAGLTREASQSRAAPPATDPRTAATLRDVLVAMQEATERLRKKEEEAAGGRITDGPGSRASQALSQATEAVKASLGEAGMKVKVSGAVVAPTVKGAGVTPDGNLQRATLAGRYAALLARMGGEQAQADEEARQKNEAVTTLRGPKRI
ncbi:MAG: hypothetical protein HY904_20055 [Deltaproteobacteria bacterium]|nr:hypothetical protein [Deltaproteobacteria bacterium]